MNGVGKLMRYARMGWMWRHWYDDAQEYIVHECIYREWDHDEFINIMSIMSPRVSVAMNWKLAVGHMEGAVPWGVMRSTRQALAYYQETGHIRGPKTSAFARALRGDTTALVLDTWMSKALGVEHKHVTTKANMRKALTRVTKVATILGLCVRDTQAAIWAGVCLAHHVRPGNLQDAVQGTSQMSMEF